MSMRQVAVVFYDPSLPVDQRFIVVNAFSGVAGRGITPERALVDMRRLTPFLEELSRGYTAAPDHDMWRANYLCD